MKQHKINRTVLQLYLFKYDKQRFRHGLPIITTGKAFHFLGRDVIYLVVLFRNSSLQPMQFIHEKSEINSYFLQVFCSRNMYSKQNKHSKKHFCERFPVCMHGLKSPLLVFKIKSIRSLNYSQYSTNFKCYFKILTCQPLYKVETAFPPRSSQ